MSHATTTTRTGTIALVVILLMASYTVTAGPAAEPDSPESSTSYPTVQAAVDAAPPGAVVVLHASNHTQDPAPWTESVVIPVGKDGLTLCGAAPDPTQDPGPVVVHPSGNAAQLCDTTYRDNAIIDASGHNGTALHVKAHNVTITGLTLRWSIEAWDLWLDLVGHLDAIQHPVEAVRVDGAGLTFTDNNVLVKAGPCMLTGCAGLVNGTGLRLGDKATGAHITDNDFTADPLDNPSGWLGGDVGLSGILNGTIVEGNIFSAWTTAAVSVSLLGQNDNALRNNTFIAGGPLVITGGHGRLDATANDLRGAQPTAFELQPDTREVYLDAAESDWGTYTCDLIHGTPPLPGRIRDHSGQNNSVGVSPFVMPLNAPLTSSCPIVQLRIDDHVRNVTHDADDGDNRTYTATAFDPYGGEVPVDSHDEVQWTIADGGGTFDGNVLAPGNRAGNYTVDASLKADSSMADATELHVVPGAPTEIIADHVSTKHPTADHPFVNLTFAVSDRHGNAVPNATVTATFTGPRNDALSNVTNQQDGTYNVILSTTKTSDDRFSVTGAIPDASHTVDDIVVIPGTPTQITADNVSTKRPTADHPVVNITFAVSDRHGNAVPNATVDATFTGPGALSPVVNQTDGTYSVTLTTTNTANDTFSVTGAIPGANHTVDDIVVVPGTPTQITADKVSTKRPTADHPVVNITFAVSDRHGNAVPNATVDATFTGPGTAELSPVVNQTDGTYNVTLTTTNRSADTFSVTGAIPGANHTVDDIVVIPGTPTQITADNVSTKRPTGDQPTVDITFAVSDRHGNAVSNATVNATFTGPGTAELSPVVNQTDGTYNVTLTTTNRSADRFSVTGSIPGANHTVDDIVVIPGTPTQITADHVSTKRPTADQPTVDITFAVADRHGNAVPNATVNATFTGPGTAELSPVVNQINGTYSVTLTTTNRSADRFSVTGSIPGANHTVDDIVVQPGNPREILTHHVSTLRPTAVEPTVNITFKVRDNHTNLVPGVTVTASVNAPGNLSTVTDHDDGTYGVTLTTTSNPGDQFTVTGQAAGVAEPAIIDGIQVITGDPSQIRIKQVEPLTPSADQPFVDIVFEIIDASGNPLSGLDLNATVSGSRNGPLEVHPQSNGTYHVSLNTTRQAGDLFQVTAQLQTGGGQLNVSTPEILVIAGSATSLELVELGAPATTADDPVTQATWRVTDNAANPVTDATVSASYTGPDGATIDDPVPQGDGHYTATFTTTRTAGHTFQVIGHLHDGDDIITSTTSPDIRVLPGIATTILVDHVSTLTPTADDAQVDITFRVQDSHANDVPGIDLAATSTGPTSGALTNITDHGDGTYTTTLTTSRTAGDTFQVTAELDTAEGQLSISTPEIRVTVGAAFSLQFLHLTTQNTTADDPVTQATWRVTDNASNPVTDATVTASFTGPDGATIDDPVSQGDGNYTANFTTTRTAGHTFQATGHLHDGDHIVTSTATPDIQVLPGIATTILVDHVSTLTPTADDAQVDITFRVRDNHSNDVPGANLSATLATPTNGALANITDHGDGTYTTTLTTSRTAGDTYSVTGAIPVANSTIEGIQVVPGTPAVIAEEHVSTFRPTADEQTVNITFAVSDGHGNRVSNVTVETSLSGPEGGELSHPVDQGDGTYHVTLTTTNRSGDEFSVTGAIADANHTVDDIVVVPGAAHEILEHTVSTLRPTADEPTVHITFQVRDEHTNPVPGAAVTASVDAPDGTLSQVSDHGDGTYGLTLTTTSKAGDVFNVTAHAEGVATPASIGAIEVIAGDPAQLRIHTVDPLRPSADSPLVDIVFEILDDHDNHRTGLDLTASVSGASHGPLEVRPQGSGAYHVRLHTTTTAGDTFQVTAQLETSDGPLNVSTPDIRVTAGAASLLQFLDVTPSNTTADDPFTHVTWRVTDNASNAVSNASLTASFTGPDGATINDPVSQGDGRYTANFTSTRTADHTFQAVGHLHDGPDIIASATSSEVKVGPGAPTTVLVDRISTLAPTADEPSVDITFRVRDGHGNDVRGISLTAARTGPASGALTSLVEHDDGTYTTTLTTSRTAGDVFTVVADLPGVGQAATGDITVIPGAPAAVTVTSPTSGTTVEPDDPHATLTFRVSDAYGNAVPGAALTADVDHAQGVLGDIVDHGDGTYSVALTTTDTPGDRFHVTAQVRGADGLDLDTTAPHIRVAGRALAFDTFPTEVASGVPFDLSIRILDEQGDLASTANDQIVLALQSRPAGATLHGAKAQQATSGIATFTDLTLDKAGTYTIVANAAELGTSTTAEIAVVPGPAARLFFDSVPQNAVTGEAFTVSVRLHDGHGNQVTDADEQVTLSVFHGPTTLDETRHAQTGLVTFMDIHLDAAGQYNLRASAPGLQSATSPTVDVRAPPPSSLRVLASESHVESGDGFTVRIEVVDPDGALVTDGTHPVTLSRATGPLGANLRGERTQPTEHGIAIFEDLTLDVAGNHTLHAQSTGLGSTTTPPIDVRPGPPAQLRFAPLPHRLPLDTHFDATLEVLDQSGNRVANLSDQDTLTLNVASGPSDGLQGELQRAATGGTADWESLRFNQTGAYQLNAELDWQSGKVLRATSPTLTVGPGAPTALQFASLPTRATSGAPFSTIVHVLDAEGNLAVDAQDPVVLTHATGPANGRLSGTLSAPPVDGVATFTGLRLDLAGLHSLHATVAGITQQSNGITVDPGAAHRLVFDAVADATAAFSTTLRVEDPHGNRVRQADHPVTLSIANGPTGAALTGTTTRQAVTGLAAFPDIHVSVPGTYRVLARSPGLESALSPVLLINGPGIEDVAALELQPPGELVVTAGHAMAFSVTGTDAHGVAVDAPLAVSYVLSNPNIGHIDTTGTFRGIRAGAVELHARLGDITSEPVTLLVTPAELARLRISPESTSVPPGEPVTFIAAGTDAFGNRVAVTNVSWSANDFHAANLSGNQPFRFVSHEGDSRQRIQATSGGVTGAASAIVTNLHVSSGTEAILNATSSHTRHLNTSTSTHTAGVGSAEAGARLRVGAQQANATGVSTFDARIDRDAYRLSVNVESRDGTLETPPEGLDLSDLVAHLAETATSPVPALFIRVSASEGGQDVTSIRLNELLGSINATFWLPDSYFANDGLDRDRVQLIEYSDGERRPTEILATRTSSEVVNGSVEYRVQLKSFSAFAVIAVEEPAAVAPVGGGTGGGGGGGGGDGDGRGHPTTEFHEVVLEDDPLITGARLELADGAALPGLQIRSRAQAPVNMPALPDGLHVVGYVDVDLGTAEASPKAITFRLSLPADQVDEPRRGHLMRLVDGSWLREDRLELAERDGRFVGNASGKCCSLFAIIFDTDPPALTLAIPPTPVVGTVSLAAHVSDNLGVAQVEFRFAGQRLVVLDTAPYTLELDTAQYDDGSYVLDVVATDVSGWSRTATQSVQVQNDAPVNAAAAEPAEAAPPPAWLGVVLILGALLLAVGAMAYLRRDTKRRAQ